MLPLATRHLVDRLVTALMTLVRAVAPADTPERRPTLSEAAAQTLFFRVSHLVLRLIRIRAFGLRTRDKPEPDTEAPDPCTRDTATNPPARRKTAPPLPRHPGWLLDALPHVAPPVAAALSALLADPAIATLLDEAPSLDRSLRSLMRALGIDDPVLLPTPPQPPPPNTFPPAPTPPTRASSRAPTPTIPSKRTLPAALPTHAPFVTIS